MVRPAFFCAPGTRGVSVAFTKARNGSDVMGYPVASDIHCAIAIVSLPLAASVLKADETSALPENWVCSGKQSQFRNGTLVLYTPLYE
jgi:hypothetical protein